MQVDLVLPTGCQVVAQVKQQHKTFVVCVGVRQVVTDSQLHVAKQLTVYSERNIQDACDVLADWLLRQLLHCKLSTIVHGTQAVSAVRTLPKCWRLM